MNLIEKIEIDFKEALSCKNQEKLSVLRLLKSAIKNFEIQEKRESTDEDILKLIQKEVKQRENSVESYIKGQRPELAAKEEAENKILLDYLPKQLSEQELTDIVQAAINEVEATADSNIGKIMGKVMPKVGGRSNGGAVSAKVRELLSK